MKTGNRHIELPVFFATLVIILLYSGSAFAVDDGARAYWKGRDGTNGVSFQYLSLDLQGSDSQQFAPGQYVYPNSDVEANIFIANYVRHITLFNRPSSFSFGIAGGSVDLKSNAKVPPQFVPPGIIPGVTFNQSASGYADPILQLDVNLFGTPPLKSNVDLLNQF